MSSQPQTPPEVFVSYSHVDAEYKEHLVKQLEVLAQQNIISQWHDGLLVAGERWNDEIVKRLKTSRVILLLISVDFLTSIYINDVEMKEASRRYQAGDVTVIPILVRNVHGWKKKPFGDFKLGDLQALPSYGKFIKGGGNLDDAFANVADGIQRAVEELASTGHSGISQPSLGHTSDKIDQVSVDHEVRHSIVAPPAANLAGRREATKSVEVFYSYSHHDEQLRDQLDKHLAMLKRNGIISGWHDRRIGAGQDWEGQINEHLNSASLILLLVSSDFLASDYCYDVEVKKAMQRHEAGEARVLPIILRSCDWTSAPFGKLNPLPKDAIPVRKWLDQDEAFFDITKGLRQAVAEISERILLRPPQRSVPVYASSTNGTLAIPTDHDLRSKLIQLRQFEQDDLIDESVKNEYQRKLLERWIEKE